jgi:hypothetical protein
LSHDVKSNSAEAGKFLKRHEERLSSKGSVIEDSVGELHPTAQACEPQRTPRTGRKNKSAPFQFIQHFAEHRGFLCVLCGSDNDLLLL